jgi:thioredoxin-related protein
MSKANQSRYTAYRIKEVNGIPQFDQDGKAVLGEKIRDVKLTKEAADYLNKHTELGKVYVSEKSETKAKKEVDGEFEQKEVKAESVEKLRELAKELGIKGAHMMKEETLIEKIKETENK